MSIASLLASVEQAGLRWEIGSLRRPLNPRRPSFCAAHRRIDIAVTEAKAELARVTRVRGVSQCLARAVGYPDEAAAQRTLGMNQLSHFPECRELLGQAHNPIFYKLTAQPPRDEVHVGAGISRAGGERPRQPFANLVKALHDRRKDRLRLGPAANGQVEPFAAAFRPPS